MILFREDQAKLHVGAYEKTIKKVGPLRAKQNIWMEGKLLRQNWIKVTQWGYQLGEVNGKVNGRSIDASRKKEGEFKSKSILRLEGKRGRKG